MRKGIVGALSFGALVLVPSFAEASSHREAPFISKNPKVDGTDFYAFESYESGHAGMVTLIANYQPLEDAYAGPNYFAMDPNALYEILIDNNGDGVEDLTFQFQFQEALAGTNSAGLSLPIGGDAGMMVAVPFYNVGLIPNASNSGNSGSLNVLETYTVGLVRGPRRGSSATPIANPIFGAGNVFTKPADNVGAKSFDTTSNPLGAGAPSPPAASGYAAYANNFIYSSVAIPGCGANDASTAQIFVGQRAESFAANLGPVFDLVDAPAGVITGGLTQNCLGTTGKPCYALVPNPIGAKNVTTIAIELPADCITESASQPVIGAWSTASVRQVRVINPAATYALPSYEGGAWTQVSRVGNPLVNELIIGLPDKDRFNGSEPVNDATATGFANYLQYPTLPAVMDLIFGSDFQPTTFPRTDLVTAFFLGLPGVNAFVAGDGGTGGAVVPAEYIHLNTNMEAAAGNPVTPAGSQNRLGAALCVVQGSFAASTLTPYAPLTSCDPFGFPNGRRPIDDVVDLALDVVEGYLMPSGNPAYSGTNAVYFTDGVDQAATPFQVSFPYLSTPTEGANGDGT
jgi:hypothetical protein